MTWNPDQYDRFRTERSQPFFDLLDLVKPMPDMKVVDLGCGTGELTAAMHEKLKAAHTLGIDSAVSMLEKSAPHERNDVTFALVRIEDFVPEAPLDLVFSNAALQWIDDHDVFFERLRGWLKPGGQLAVQMPTNHDHPSHLIAQEVASEEPFAAALHGYVRLSPVLAIERYAEILHRLGFAEQCVRTQVYGHLLSGPEDVVEWVKGTLLTAYESRLSADLFSQFLKRYRDKLLARTTYRQPYFYPFKRLLMWARLPA